MDLSLYQILQRCLIGEETGFLSACVFNFTSVSYVLPGCYLKCTKGGIREGFRVSFASCLSFNHIKPYKTLRIKIEKELRSKSCDYSLTGVSASLLCQLSSVSSFIESVSTSPRSLKKNLSELS